jgi:hypothetical protein
VIGRGPCQDTTRADQREPSLDEREVVSIARQTGSDSTLAAQPLAVREQESRALEGPASEVCGERVVEAPLRFGLVVREQRARMSQVQLDPDGWPRAGRRLNLREQLSALVDAVDVEGGLGEVADEPTGDDGVVGRIGRVE